MKTCKDCKFWDGERGEKVGECLIDWVDNKTQVKADSAAIYAYAPDDHGLTAGLWTGCDFGCVRYEQY